MTLLVFWHFTEGIRKRLYKDLHFIRWHSELQVTCYLYDLSEVSLGFFFNGPSRVLLHEMRVLDNLEPETPLSFSEWQGISFPMRWTLTIQKVDRHFKSCGGGPKKAVVLSYLSEISNAEAFKNLKFCQSWDHGVIPMEWRVWLMTLGIVRMRLQSFMKHLILNHL